MRLDELHALQEMRVKYNNEYADFLIAFRDSIWIIDEEADLVDADTAMYGETDVAMDIAKTLGYESLDDVEVEELRHERPDVLTARINRDEKTLYVAGTGIMQHPVTSKLLRKVVKQLGIVDVEVEHLGSNDGEEFVSYNRSELRGDLPEYGYHGTSLRRAQMIVRQGIQPQHKSNWANIHTEGTIFFGAGVEDPKFHAVRTAHRSSGIPVILRFKVPDKNKIIPDYDVAGTIYGTGDEALANTVYRNTEFMHRAREQDRIKGSAKRPHKLFQGMNVFGYKGRIPPSHIRDALCTFEEVEGDHVSDEPTFYPITIPELKELIKIVDEFGTEIVTPSMRGVTYERFVELNFDDEDEDY